MLIYYYKGDKGLHWKQMWSISKALGHSRRLQIYRNVSHLPVRSEEKARVFLKIICSWLPLVYWKEIYSPVLRERPTISYSDEIQKLEVLWKTKPKNTNKWYIQVLPPFPRTFITDFFFFRCMTHEKILGTRKEQREQFRFTHDSISQ